MTPWRTRFSWPVPHKDNQPDRRKIIARRCLQLALLLLVIGLVPGILALWSQRHAAAAVVWRDPADNIQVAAVAPDLALLSLAGVSDDEALALAIEKGELATVHALLALSTDLSDAQRTNAWLWLAYRYHQTDQGQRAVQAYHLAGHGAIMGTNLAAMLRAETLLAVGRGLTELHDQVSARFFLKQAAIIAAYSPHLTPNYRRSLLERLIPTSLRAGGGRDDWKALATAVKNGAAQGGNIADSGTADRAKWQEGPSIDDAALVQARNKRRALAAKYLEAVIAGSDTDDGQPQNSALLNAEQALRSALLDEDAAVQRYITRHREAQTTMQTAQLVLLRWLLLKRRVAAGGFKSGLVPEWESNREGIDAALTVAWADWLALQKDAATAGPMEDLQALPAGLARETLIAAYWGLYPDAPVVDLASTQPASSFGRLRLSILEPGSPPLVGWSD